MHLQAQRITLNMQIMRVCMPVYMFLCFQIVLLYFIMGLPTFHFQESFNCAYKYNMIISSKFADSIQRRNAMINAIRFTGTAAWAEIISIKQNSFNASGQLCEMNSLEHIKNKVHFIFLKDPATKTTSETGNHRLSELIRSQFIQNGLRLIVGHQDQPFELFVSDPHANVPRH